MENLFAFSIIIGGTSFLILMILVAAQQRFPSLRGRNATKAIENTVVWVLLICGLILIATLLISYLSKPSAFEKCMEDTKNMIDPQAIAWMEDYCASIK
jgi:H+/Cl- antiporter ClcA